MRAWNHGLTLTELMVSLAVGILVSLAAVQIFVTNQQSFSLQRGMGDVQDNGRFALDFIGREVRMADLQSTNAFVSAKPAGIVMRAGEIPGGAAATITGNDTIVLGIGRSDQLTIQRVSTVDNNRDCEGNVVPVNNMIVSRYFVRADATSASAAALACDAGNYVPPSGALAGFGDQGVVLVSAVDSFQVLYGINNATDTGCEPVRFVTAATFQAIGAPEPSIVAAKVGLLIRSTDPTGKLPASSGFRVLDTTLNASQIPVDGRVRRLFTTSMSLRNSVPPRC